MHGSTPRRSTPFGSAPFLGIGLLALVLVFVIGFYSLWQYRDSVRATHSVAREARGLHFVSRAMHALLDWGALGAEPSAQAALRIDADLNALEDAAGAMPDVPQAAIAATNVRRAWTAARDGGTSASFGEALLDGIARVADASGLAFDPEAEINELGDALDNPLALEFERLTAAYASARGPRSDALGIPARLAVAGQVGAAETSSAPLAVDMRGAFAADPAVRARLGDSWQMTERAATTLRERLAATARDDGGGATGHELAAAHAALIASTSLFAAKLAGEVSGLLDARLAALERDRLAILAQLGFGIVLSVLIALLIGRDVLRRQRRALLRAQRDSAAEQFRTIFERSPIGIAMLDRGGAIVESNPGLGAMLDAPSVPLVAPDDPEYAALVQGHMGFYRFERHWTRNDGSSLWAEVNVSPVGGTRHGRVAAIAMVQDVTERRASDATLRYAATHDALTALPNRPEFIRRLRDVIASDHGAGRYAVLFIDLDGFKAVNDRYGHLTGDRVLETAAARIRKASRTSDLVARFHGDEFGLLIAGVDGMAIAGAVAERIQEELRAPILIDGQRVCVAPSIGIVLGDARYRSAEEVLRDADAAMYQAKSLGGSCAVAFEYQAAS